MKSVVLAAALVLSGWSSVNGQSAGDYGSWVSGFWNTAGTWRVYDGSSWATSPAAATPPNANNNVYIRAGTTVTAAFGFMYYCSNLYVEASGRLYNNNLGANNLSYVFVYGTDIICNGNIGNGATYDGISFSIEGANVAISGTGTFNAARLNKRRNTHIITGVPMAVSNLTVSMLVTLRFANTALLNYGLEVPVGGSSTFNVTIAPTGTINVISGSVAIDGDNGADGKNLGGTIIVNGILLVQGTLYLTTNNAAGGVPCSVVVNNGGYIRASTLDSPASGAAGHSLVMNNGGTVEVNGAPSWNTYAPAGNTFTLQTNSQFIYSALINQGVQGTIGGGYGHLRITGAGLKTAAGTVLVKGNLLIDNVAGAPILVASGFQITVQGNWTNYNQSGFSEGAALVMFNGTAGSQTITTTGGEQFYNLTISKTSAQPLVTFGSNVQVASELQMNGSGAIIDLNGRQLTLLNPSTTALRVQSGAAFGTAKHIRSERTDNASRVRWDIGSTTGAHLVPFGTLPPSPTYIPFTFNLTSGNAGSVTMATYGTPPDNLPWPTTPTLVTTLGSYLGLLFPDNRDATVDRFWQVDVTGTPTTELTFTYAPSELPIAPYDNPVSLRAQRWNLPSQLWETQLTGSAAAYWAVADVVTTYGPFTLSNIISPLPIELLQFDAQPVGEQVSLEWITATERANAFFTVLRSQDGVTYRELERVDGAGTSVVPLAYHTMDPDPLPGLSYYKLRQTDLDGRSTESSAVPVRFIGGAGAPVLYPNPAREAAFIAGLPEGPAEVAVADGIGRIVTRFRKEDDGSRVELPLGGLPAGHYVVTVTADQGRWALRLVRE